MGAGVTVIGLTTLTKKLKNAEKNLDRMTEMIAREIEAEAKRNAPVRTGRLRASIRTVKRGDAHYTVGTNVHYAPYVEFGTRKMAAKPYLRPAARQVALQWKAQGRGIKVLFG